MFTFNQRSVDEILQMILVVGGIVGRADRAQTLVDELRSGLDAIRSAAATWPRRPRVYFEEWDDPLISGIRWVEELAEIAGGTPIFPELASAGLGQGPHRRLRRGDRGAIPRSSSRRGAARR